MKDILIAVVIACLAAYLACDDTDPADSYKTHKYWQGSKKRRR